MPNSFRTDTRVSGNPGMASAASVWGCDVATFINPPFPPARRAGLEPLKRRPFRRKAGGHPSANGGPPPRLNRRPASDQLVGPQVVIGLDDFAQFLFRR